MREVYCLDVKQASSLKINQVTQEAASVGILLVSGDLQIQSICKWLEEYQAHCLALVLIENRRILTIDLTTESIPRLKSISIY